jgi:outer membrane protein OmpA-like peptidoglycan-associated protein
LFLLFTPVCIKAQDVPGSRDHELITRYPGSVIGYYEEQKYAVYNVATGPQTGYKLIEKWEKPEGKLTRIYYTVKGQTTLTELYRNYQTALNKSGFKTLAQGVDDKRNTSQAVGGRTFLGTFYASNPFPVDKGIQVLNGSSTSGGSFYIASQLKNTSGEVYVTIDGSQYAADEKVVLVDILEKTSMEDDLISVNAIEMQNSIRQNGKVTLYGIFFDTDKSDLKPESKPALEEISKLLKADPQLNLYVVGHTDMQGSFQHNMQLSEKRAAAVIADLIKSDGVAASRLTPVGVGPSAPVSTNKSEKGRKLNRRVELVERTVGQ